MDLETAGIEIVPTANVTEHLALDGNTVKILQIDGQRARFFDSFHDNQLANALGLSLLGHEFFASIWALLHKDVHMIPVAEELGFIKISNDFEREFLRLSLQDVLTTTSAKILGARVTELKKLVVRCQKQPETPTPPEGLGDSLDSPRRPVRSPSPSSPEYNKLISDATELMLLRPDEIDELSLVLFEESIPDNLNRAHLQSIAIEIRDIQRGYSGQLLISRNVCSNSWKIIAVQRKRWPA
ncbi:hypothetical protein BD779DRAFT_155077 [Infundibulicybe gibba]|nr:hypothetical protein BD779DRAFT_155077 [Infundibulicybe gibba]